MIDRERVIGRRPGKSIAELLLAERLAKFGRAVDRREFHKLEQTFAGDVLGAYNGHVAHRSLAELVSAMERNLGAASRCGETLHNIMNLEVEFDGAPDKAVSFANFYALHEGLKDYEGQTYKTWGVYHDFWTLTPGGWRIRERRYTTLFNEGPKAIVGL